MNQPTDKISITLTYSEQDWQYILDIVEMGAITQGKPAHTWALSFRRDINAIIQQVKAKSAESERSSRRPSREECYDDYDNSDQSLTLEDYGINPDDYPDLSEEQLWDTLD